MAVCNCANLDVLAAVLRCSIGFLPTVYLGLPLGAKTKAKQLWEPVVERCRKRLAGWKTIYLSAGARITLVKSVLSSLPTYFLSLFPAPISVIKEIEHLQRNFLWGRSEEVFKHNLVAWNVVCKPLHAGGVGIRKLHLHNEALMGKWLWRFAQERAGLWRKIIVSKYGEGIGGWLSDADSHAFGNSLWNCIRRKWVNFDKCISWKVGKGDRTLLWKHAWLEVGCLATVFPEIYRIASDKNALITDYCTGNGVNRDWNIQLQRNLNDWEVDSFGELLEMLYATKLDNSDDSLIWKWSADSSFSVKSFYLWLMGAEEDDFPWRKIWTAAVPTRITFFAWCATRGKILTLDNLKHRGFHLANRCSLCLRNEESIDHILLHCPWSSELWDLILACFGVSMCFPNCIKIFLVAWWGQQMGKRRKKTWKLIPFCLFWLIWKERNRRTFENNAMSILRAKSLLLSYLYSWVHEGRELEISSFLHLLSLVCSEFYDCNLNF